MKPITQMFTWLWPNHEELAKTSKQLNRNYWRDRSVLFQWQGKLHLIRFLYPVLHCVYHVTKYVPLGAGPQEWGTEEWHLWWIFIPHSLHWRPCLKNPQIKLPQWSHQVGLLKLVLLKQCDSSTVSSFRSFWTGLFRSSISTICSTDTKYLSESKHTVPVGLGLIYKLANYLFLIFCTDFFNRWMHALIPLWH